MSTQSQILANMIAAGFDNPSQAALYNKQAETLGEIVDVTITEINNNRQSILDIINKQRYGKSGYYTGIAKAFQYGDDLIIDPITLDFTYATVDTTKQIITQAAFEEVDSGNSASLFLKVATTDTVTGLLVQLTAPQYSAFSSYFVNFEIPGLPVTIGNTPANVLAFISTATYLATYNLSTLQTNLAAALAAFQKSFDFDGTFYAGDLQDYIKQNVPGIRDFFIQNTSLDAVPFSGSINLGSGYFNYAASVLTSITYTSVNA